jgi:putative ABC transport system permease protein
VKGILKLAYKLLANDRAKFTALLIGVTFASFSMIFISSMFVGVMNHSSSTIINIGAPMWVMDPAVQIPANSIGMPDYVLDAVRSMQGVEYAVPLYSGTALVKLPNGDYQPTSVMGLDDTTLFGRPDMVNGKITDIYAENGFIVVQDGDYSKLGSPRVGWEFQINDYRGVIVGTSKVAMSGLFGMPTLYTTYNRAIQYIPNPRYTISYVLVQPKSPTDIAQIQQQVTTLGYRALTKDEFMSQSIRYYIFQTGMGVNLLIMTAITFAVGLSVSGQTFYTFVLENLERFGALKAIGTTSRELILIILFQVSFTTVTGYGLGLGLCTLFVSLAKLRLPSYFAMITYANLLLGLIMVLIIAAVSSYASVRRVLRIEPFEIFRG